MLNKAQQEAVDTINGQLLMIACPGSGKTTTMVHRIANMVNQGVNPFNIIMMTFTKAAAEEMESRYLKMDGAKEGVTFCTIHSLCLGIVKEVGCEYTVIDEQDKWGYFEEKLKWSRKVADLETFISDLLLDISRKKTNPCKDVLIQCTSDKSYFNWLYQEYETYKSERRLIDYDDMIVLAYESLCQNPIVLKKYQQRYKYIQVDEYQDTDEIQKNVIYMIAGENGNLAVCGDEDQSIYGFRGASPAIMLNFQRDYPDAKIIHMGTNYRSTPDIVEKAGILIKENKMRFAKEFLADKKENGKISKFSFKNKREEVNYISETIKAAIASGTNPNEIAILYRNNSQAEDFGYQFISRGIPFKVAGGMPNKFEHFIWKDIMLFKKVATENGKQFDVERVLNKPQRWVKMPSLVDFPDVDVEGRMKISYGNEEFFRMKVFDDAFKEESWKTKAKAKAVSDFFTLLRSLSVIKDPASFMRKLWPTYKKHLDSYASFRQIEFDTLKDRYEDYIDEAEKHGNRWDELFEYVNSYNAILKKNKNSKTGVTLSTMHKAKGLEWETVYVVDCINGICPSESRHGFADLEEERRLFYVATTRAKTNLFLTNYNYERYKPVRESPFLTAFASR